MDLAALQPTALDRRKLFRGTRITTAAVFHVLVWVLGVELLAGPWILEILWILGFHHGSLFGIHPRPIASLNKLLLPDALALSLLVRYQSIYRNLSRRLQQGKPDYQLFVELRLAVASLALGFVVLLIVAILHSSR